MVMMVIEFFDLDPDKGRGGKKRISTVLYTSGGFFSFVFFLMEKDPSLVTSVSP